MCPAPEHLAHDLGIRAGRQLKRRERVPEIMEPDARQLGVAK